MDQALMPQKKKEVFDPLSQPGKTEPAKVAQAIKRDAFDLD
jgi:hypothetical protein